MKKIILAFAALAAAFSLASCNKEQMNDQPTASVKFNITVSNLGGSLDTKAVKTAWEDGDKIDLWLGNGYLGSGPHAVLTYNSAQDKWVGETTSSFESTVQSEGAVRALYEGYNDFSKFSASSASPYATAPGYSSSTGAEMPMAVTSLSSTTYTYDGTTLTASIEWQFLTNVQVVVAGLDPDKASSYRLKSPNLTSMGGLYSASSSNPSISSGYESTGGYTKGVANKDGVAFYFTSRYRSAECNKENTWEFTLSDNTGLEAVEYTYSTTGNIGSSVYKLNAIKIDASKFFGESATTGTAKRTGDIDVTWVQLWENGPKFAEYNVGAANNKAEDYGGYYAWGGSQNKVDDHNTGSSALTGSDDTATNLWGSAWRMPTKDEFDALLANCDVEWTTVNDVNGRKFTGKGNYKDNSVFLPAAGICLYGYVTYQDNNGYYWSSSPRSSNNFAYVLYFDSDNQKVNYDERSHGFSVRAVLAE